MRANILRVWLHGRPLGELERLRNTSLRLRFSEQALDDYGIGSTALSLSLPVTQRRVEGVKLHRYLEGLLPEGALRSQLVRDNSLSSHDTFGLLKAVGQECAGAVQFTADGAEAPVGFLRDLNTAEVNAIVRDLPTLITPDELPLCASLGGVQSKVLLTRTSTGWAWPAAGAPSSHLIKPAPITDVTVAHLIESEHWALTLAGNAGIRAAATELDTFDGRLALIVTRYDRDPDGRRIQQEDFTQALAIGPEGKYEVSPKTPSRLTELVRLAQPNAKNPLTFARDLLTQITFNIAIGNADAHSKNYSLMIDQQGLVQLAPLYDAAPIFLLNRAYHHSGQAVNGQVNLGHITARNLVAEAAMWGITRPQGACARAAHQAPSSRRAPSYWPLVGLFPMRKWRLSRRLREWASEKVGSKRATHSSHTLERKKTRGLLSDNSERRSSCS